MTAVPPQKKVYSTCCFGWTYSWPHNDDNVHKLLSVPIMSTIKVLITAAAHDRHCTWVKTHYCTTFQGKCVFIHATYILCTGSNHYGIAGWYAMRATKKGMLVRNSFNPVQLRWEWKVGRVVVIRMQVCSFLFSDGSAVYNGMSLLIFNTDFTSREWASPTLHRWLLLPELRR